MAKQHGAELTEEGTQPGGSCVPGLCCGCLARGGAGRALRDVAFPGLCPCLKLSTAPFCSRAAARACRSPAWQQLGTSVPEPLLSFFLRC